MRLVRFYSFIAFSWLAMSVCAFAQNSKTSPVIWGTLRSGSYAVGFRSFFRFDASRTWKSTRSYDGSFSPDNYGRPVQINIWYPASPASSDKKMRFTDYVNQSAPEEFSKINGVMQRRNREDAAGAVPRSEFPKLQATEMDAFRDAKPVAGRFPVVLYFGGLSAQINDNLVMAEYLASHGYAFASISLVGPTNEETFQSRTSEGLEASVRDMEFAWSALQNEPYVDKTKLAVMGHSVGAVEAVILGMRDANVSAVIGLDGTYGFAGLSTVLTSSYAYDPEKMRTPILDLRRAQGAQGNEPLDLSAIESFHHADRTFITIARMHHSDFTSFAMVGEHFHTPLPTSYALNGWNRESGRAGYESVCRIVLAKLDRTFKPDHATQGALESEVHKSSEISMKHEDAILPPPSPLEAAELARSHGLDAAEGAFVRSCGSEAVAACLNLDRFNTWGYNLLGQQRGKDALAVFQLNAWAHPQAANVQDSLSDGYAALGDRENARKALERAISLAPTDASLDGLAKQSFLSEEQAKLKHLQ